jgi:hypothetical protein
MQPFCAANAVIPEGPMRSASVARLQRTVAELWDVPIAALVTSYRGEVVRITFCPTVH